MGTLTRQVRLSEGAKPGIPTLSYTKVETESVQMKILVRILKTEDLKINSRNLFMLFKNFFQEHPAELHLGIIGFEIEYKEEDWEWDLAYHQYLHLSM